MREYHKIETVFNRSTDGDKRLIWGDYRNETVEYLANNIGSLQKKLMEQILEYIGMDIV